MVIVIAQVVKLIALAVIRAVGHGGVVLNNKVLLV
jgi:hypothetical protein